MPRRPTDKLNLAALRAQAEKKPRTKAGQIRQAWPEIRYLLASGHSLKDVWIWLKEIGLVIPYTRLSEYVNELRRAEPPPSAFRPQSAAGLPAAAPEAEPNNPERGRAEQEPAKRDPLSNVRRTEANRRDFPVPPRSIGEMRKT